jgi:hypothetical protein
VFITVKSVEAEAEDGVFTFGKLFTNQIFFTLIVSLLSTYVLWIFISIVFLDPWHIVSSVNFPPILRRFRLINTTSVTPIPPSIPNIHKRHQRLRLLQHPRRNLGYERRRQSPSPENRNRELRRQIRPRAKL